MTTPQYPWSTTTSDDLPQGVIAPNKLATTLQDHSAGKYTDLSASRFPSIAKSTSAGSPASVGGPMGFVVGVFSRIVSGVATSDPATINGPDDIAAHAGDFFSGLPLLSFIGDIAHSITGAIGGGLNTIRQFFDDLVGNALQGINPFSIFTSIGNIFFHQSAVANTATSASSGVASIISQIVGGWSGSVPPAAGQVAQTMNEIRSATIGSSQVVRLYGSGTWTVPDGYRFFDISGWNGADGAGAGTNTALNGSGNPGEPGTWGGFRSRTFTLDDLGGAGAQIPFVGGSAGAGGTQAGQPGGQGQQSTFGTPSDAFYMAPTRGRSEMASPLGYSASTSRGGGGGRAYGGNGVGYAGESASDVPGGAGGAINQQAPSGQDAPLTLIPSGGSGGGGAGGNGAGGNGGAPGGGGGAGGYVQFGGWGRGGNGGHGRWQITCR